MALVRDCDIPSGSLCDTRTVSIFLPAAYHSGSRSPVLYCADGQALGIFAERLQYEMETGNIPWVLLVGAHSHSELRAKEYIPGVNNERFSAHEEFFTDERCRWTKSEFCVSATRDTCGLFGFSNGAIFAVTMGARHREKYGAVIAFSVPGGAERFTAYDWTQPPRTKFYLSAGTREKPIRECSNSTRSAQKLRNQTRDASQQCAHCPRNPTGLSDGKPAP